MSTGIFVKGEDLLKFYEEKRVMSVFCGTAGNASTKCRPISAVEAFYLYLEKAA